MPMREEAMTTMVKTVTTTAMMQQPKQQTTTHQTLEQWPSNCGATNEGWHNKEDVASDDLNDKM